MNLKKSLNKYKKSIINSLIYSKYNHGKIDDNLIYIESKNGDDFSSNIMRIIEELSNEEYSKFKIYVYAKKEVIPYIKEFQNNYNLKIDKFISNDISASRTIEQAKYIITDSKIRFRYVKRDGQIIINAYHENPVKFRAVDTTDNKFNLANQQHPYLLADYLICSNEYSYETILKSILIENSFSGKLLKEGSPRNIAFFNENTKKDFQSKLKTKNKEVFAYVPRYWGSHLHKKFLKSIKKVLKKLDKQLNDNQVMFFNVEGYNKKLLNFSKFKHIKAIPKGYDLYDVLNLSDILITDYSSVLLDFTITKRKIILFNHDNGKYLVNNPNYISNLCLPFVRANSIDDLIKELDYPKYPNYTPALGKLSPYDHENLLKNICHDIFLNKHACMSETISNNNPNILIYAGGVFNNEIFNSLIELLSQVDKNKYNFFITFRQWGKNFKKDQNEILKTIPKGINIIPIKTRISPTFLEKINYDLFINLNLPCNNIIRKMFDREFKKQFHNLSFDYVLNFEGFHKNESLMFYNNNAKSSFWIHNDVMKEIENNRLSSNILKEVFNNYDEVVVVSSDLISSTNSFNGELDKIKIAHNLFNTSAIDSYIKKPLTLDKDTEVYTNNASNIKGVLNNPSKKIISISRKIYNLEWDKNLLNAFDEFCENYPDVQLIIIGDVGSFYRLRRLVLKLKHWKNVTIIKNIPNYLPILNECDLFILSDDYRNHRKYISEADYLNIPIISVENNAELLNEFDGLIIENSEEEILEALNMFMDDEINRLNINWNEQNIKYLNEFNNIIKK